MEGLHLRGGRYVPVENYGSDAERLRALEAFLARYSEETEYALEKLEQAVAELQSKVKGEMV